MEQIQETRKLRFVLTGEALTRIVRDTWASDLPKKAINILVEGLHMTVEQALKVCTGEWDLKGATDEGDGSIYQYENKDTYLEYVKSIGMDLTIDGCLTRTLKNYKEQLINLNIALRESRIYCGIEDKDNPGTLKEMGFSVKGVGEYRNSYVKIHRPRLESMKEGNQSLVDNIHILLPYSKIYSLQTLTELTFEAGSESLSRFEVQEIEESIERMGETSNFLDQIRKRTKEEKRILTLLGYDISKVNGEKKTEILEEYERGLVREKLESEIVHTIGAGVVWTSQEEKKKIREKAKKDADQIIEREKGQKLKGQKATKREYNDEVEKFNIVFEDFLRSLVGVIYPTEEQIEQLIIYSKKERELEKRRDTLYDLLNSDYFRELKKVKTSPPIWSEPKGNEHDAYILPDGRFFETHFQGHTSLERDLIQANFVSRDLDRYDASFVNFGLIKISSGQIICYPWREVDVEGEDIGKYLVHPDIQLETLSLWMLGSGREKFNIGYSREENGTMDQVINYIKSRDRDGE